MSRQLCPCGMNIKCGYVVTRKDETKFCSQDMNCEASNKWLVEHDTKLLEKVEKIVKNRIDSYNPSYTDIYNVITELSDVVLNGITDMKGKVNE